MTEDARRDDDFGVRNLFLTDAPPQPMPRRRGTLGGLTLSLSAHVAALMIATIVASRAPIGNLTVQPVTNIPLVYALPGGGGGPMGGDNSTQPVRRAQLVGPEAAALPTVLRGRSEAVEETPEPIQRIAAPDRQVNAGLQEMVGSIAAVSAPDFGSRGPGTGPGASTGPGGQGPGFGTGEGPGLNGTGPPGNGASWPRLIVEVKPNYTAEAMRARIEGVVELDIVVQADGSVGQVRLVRSLDSRFGLDEEAIRAVRRWRFDPSRRAGIPMTVRVPVEVSFRLR
jgi:protein TonB